ncbi:MAG TPA: DUF1569 domain-containing protein [Candidatus Sulfotelmatobacter sp.]|nr:DUF1569 domain-containing protein [Candidatus Sulfotelmatobacter sp.]
MDPQLQTLRQAIASAIDGLTTEQMNWHPPGKWCTAEVLEHLYLTYTGTTKGFSRVDEAGKPLATRATWVHRGRALVVTGLGYYPSGRQAPAAARPRGLPQDTVRGEILARIFEMDNVIGRCEEKFGARHKLLDHPILGPLNTRQWKKFHLLHGLHHVKQIRQLRESAGASFR